MPRPFATGAGKPRYLQGYIVGARRPPAMRGEDALLAMVGQLFVFIRHAERSLFTARGAEGLRSFSLVNQSVRVTFEVSLVVKALRDFVIAIVSDGYGLTVIAGHDTGPEADMFHAVADLKALKGIWQHYLSFREGRYCCCAGRLPFTHVRRLDSVPINSQMS